MNAGVRLITIHDEHYPQRLREIFDPPLLLFTLGRPELLASHSIAVVGTRRPTPYGIAASERLSADLAKAGLTIVSGMARGIDTAAHRAALNEEGATIAVLGCGVDVLYPVGKSPVVPGDFSPRPAGFGVPDGRSRLSAELPDS